MSTDFDQAAYWRKRHEDLKGDPRSVGTLAQSRDVNVAGEERLLYLMRQILPTIDAPRSVLDVGCGYGRLADTFVHAGFKYKGIDVSPVAIEQAKQRTPMADFEEADLATWNTSEKYGIVFVGWVFVHFVDDRDWRSLLTRCISWVEAGGALLFADYIPAVREAKVQHAVCRPLSDYAEVFDRSGMTIDFEWRKSAEAVVRGNSVISHFHLVRHSVAAGNHR
jgi:trans-aconitate methyltransferase